MQTTHGGFSALLYHWYEMSHAAVGPARAAADSYRMFLNNPFNPLRNTAMGRSASAVCEVFERTTRRYDKPTFGLGKTAFGKGAVQVTEEVVWQKPFGRLLHFKRHFPKTPSKRDPRVLLVAPMSGHFATLLRGTVETLLPDHEVYITDWADARAVPLSAGRFDLDDYIDYIAEMIRLFEGDVHVVAVCQPSVAVLAAIALLEQDRDPHVPASMCLMGGPIDTRLNPTQVNTLAEDRGTEWFARNVVTTVPWTQPGQGRRVYPGFLQLTGFMTMNLDRHITAHKDLFFHLIEGDGDSAEKHREFYDEYLAVMDLTAEYYLQTVDSVFVKHLLPKGKLMHRGRLVQPGAITRVALMTVEGEKDDITGVGQSMAAHALCPNIPADLKMHYEQKGVGHYGIFNGSRFRSDIAPRMGAFFRANAPRREGALIGAAPLPVRRKRGAGPLPVSRMSHAPLKD
jgi:poly(3-hydroxybutyrate) depolymerase